MREAEGISLRAFSASLGNYSPSHLSRVERGLVAPSREFVEACESQLGADGLLLSLFELVKADQAEYRRLTRARGNPANGRREAVRRRTRSGDRSEFVSDLLLVDGERVKCGERLIKSWRIRNAGTVPWVGRLLRRDGPLAGPRGSSSPREPFRFQRPLPGRRSISKLPSEHRTFLARPRPIGV
ncbi:MAG: helix-turn-helix domain-containing protein [Thermomicrobiales bacterium]|nr:helix-turn-helix domain-containing protein [Thermomicrobiales bacterium]